MDNNIEIKNSKTKKAKKPRQPRQPKKSKEKKTKNKNKNTQNIKINISSSGSGGGGIPSIPASTITKTSIVPSPIQSFAQAERTGENVEVNNLLKRIENKQQSAINELSGVMNQFVIPAIIDRQQQLQLPPPQLSETPMQIKRIGRPSGSKNKPKVGTQAPNIPIVTQPPNNNNNTMFENVPAALSVFEKAINTLNTDKTNQPENETNQPENETKQPEVAVEMKKKGRPKKTN